MKLKEKDFLDLFFLGITVGQLDQIERSTEVSRVSQVSNPLSMAFESEIEEVVDHEMVEDIKPIPIEKKSNSQIVTLTGAVSKYRKSIGKTEHFLQRTNVKRRTSDKFGSLNTKNFMQQKYLTQKKSD